jgi:archaetidylinositol phosphate synthase
MIERFRKDIDSKLNDLAKPFLKFSPNTLTLLSFFFALLTPLAFYMVRFHKAALILAGVFIAISGIFDVLDGKVARLKTQESKKGDFLDHLLDRYSDFFIIGGFGLTGFCKLDFAFLGLIGTLFASYAGTQAEAVGVGRIYSGLLTRADRLILLVFAPAVQFIFYGFFGFTILELICLAFFVLGQITAIQRAYFAWKELSKKE